jgi:hypothetical protein
MIDSTGREGNGSRANLVSEKPAAVGHTERPLTPYDGIEIVV